MRGRVGVFVLNSFVDAGCLALAQLLQHCRFMAGTCEVSFLAAFLEGSALSIEWLM